MKMKRFLGFVGPLTMIIMSGSSLTAMARQFQVGELFIHGQDIVAAENKTVLGSGGGTAQLVNDDGNDVLVLTDFKDSITATNDLNKIIKTNDNYNGNIDIELKGENELSIAAPDNYANPIYGCHSTFGTFLIGGEGSLSITAAENPNGSYGIYAQYGVTINGGIINIETGTSTNSYSTAITAHNSGGDGNVINGGTVNLISKAGKWTNQDGVFASYSVRNSVAGKGWKTIDGTGDPVSIKKSTTKRSLTGYYKVQFFPAATLTTEPTGKDLTYTGSEQELITPGVIGEGATSILYALGTDSETVPDFGWYSYIPKATNPGINYVWYKVKGDETHSDSEPVCITVTIGEAIKLVFDSNGGTGTMEDQIVPKNQLTKVNSNRFTKDRYIFTGWNTKADGTGVSYEDKSEISVEATTTLYAQWEESKDHNHLPLKEVNAADPTCEEEGNKHYYECEICGKIFEDPVGQVELTKDEVIIKAIGHKWNDGEVTKEATYEEDGVRTYTCQNDPSHTKEETIPKKTRSSESGSGSSSSDSGSSGSSGSSSSDSGSSGSSGSKNNSVSKQVIDVNGNVKSNVPSNHQVETGVPASDVGGRWGNNANADTWTYTKSDGTLAKSEWLSLDYNGLRYWYYFNDDGNMHTNWFDYKGERFYLMPQKDGWLGRMATGWKNIDNKWYYFDIVPGSTQGKLFRSSITPDGHVVGADGAWNGVGETPVGQE